MDSVWPAPLCGGCTDAIQIEPVYDSSYPVTKPEKCRTLPTQGQSSSWKNWLPINFQHPATSDSKTVDTHITLNELCHDTSYNNVQLLLSLESLDIITGCGYHPGSQVRTMRSPLPFPCFQIAFVAEWEHSLLLNFHPLYFLPGIQVSILNNKFLT